MFPPIIVVWHGNDKQKKQLHFCNCFFAVWEQRESNPRPSACKADALNQLSYAPFFRFCVRLRVVGRSLPEGNSLPPHLFSLHYGKINFKKILSEIPSVKELAFGEVFSEKDCKDTQEILFCKFFPQKIKRAESTSKCDTKNQGNQASEIVGQTRIYAGITGSAGSEARKKHPSFPCP